ncbi:MAG: YidC/Oxa1 family membrane protein insertase [Candidatus Pacebacteria bacterium]|nr:YidC/Oxa1 family membrane protein insertase [Candidatus Paceibacterota bacterium]
MISNLFNTLFFNPIYNGLIFLMSSFSWLDMGMAVILVTILVKLLIFPLTKKSIQLQIAQKKIEPEIKKIKEEFKNKKEEQAMKIMELYKENNLNPLSGILIMFIQIPIIFALYFVFLKGGLPEINTDILYSFIKIPSDVHTIFLGIIDITEKSLFLAILAGISQYIQIQLILPNISLKSNNKERDFKEDLMKSMSLQMKYVMPVIIVLIAYNLPSAIALYWITSNIFMISQEIFVKRKMEAVEN